jgi:hypothetical protein
MVPVVGTDQTTLVGDWQQMRTPSSLWHARTLDPQWPNEVTVRSLENSYGCE